MAKCFGWWDGKVCTVSNFWGHRVCGWGHWKFETHFIFLVVKIPILVLIFMTEILQIPVFMYSYSLQILLIHVSKLLATNSITVKRVDCFLL